MDIKELKIKKVGDLHNSLAETRDKLRELRFKDANKQLKDVREIRTVKKTIARILSLLNNNKNSKPETEKVATEVAEVIKEEVKK